MFCDRCGMALHSGQGFGPQCGKEFVQGMHIAYPRANRVQQHLRMLGILWLALSAAHVVGGVMMFVVANTLFLRPMPGVIPDQVPHLFIHSILIFLGGVILIKSLLGFLAGWGLLQREPWARVLTLVLSFMSLFNIPLGSALGIYSLWVLLPAESDRQYEEQARAA
jgi:hypothetical protein